MCVPLLIFSANNFAQFVGIKKTDQEELEKNFRSSFCVKKFISSLLGCKQDPFFSDSRIAFSNGEGKSGRFVLTDVCSTAEMAINVRLIEVQLVSKRAKMFE
jgi:hypothetical protein